MRGLTVHRNCGKTAENRGAVPSAAEYLAPGGRYPVVLFEFLARRASTPLGPFLLALIIVSTPAAQAALAATNDESLWEFTPYRVQVLVALTPQAAQCGAIATDLPAGVVARVWSAIGARWRCTAGLASPVLREVMVHQFADLTSEQILPEIPEECDKILLVRVSYQDGIYEIAARDFDVRTQLLSHAMTDRVYHRVRLSDGVFQTVLAAFAPLARVEDVAGDKVTLRMRAAAVPPRDPATEISFDKAVFRPVVRTNDRAGKARRIQLIDWTYLVGKAASEAGLTAQMVTGLRAPLMSKRRGRLEQLALYTHLPHGATTLQLRSTDKSPHPLVGYQVYSHPIDSKETRLLGATDAGGDLRVEPGDGGVRVLLIKSGGTIMARLPLLPGLAPIALAQMPDDRGRLQVEGLINGFQEELVDLIARRQVLMSRVRARMKAGKTEEAKLLFNELRRLRSQQDFSRQLLVERQRRASTDPRTQRQIDKLFDDTQTVINKFLDARPLDRLERELNGEETAQAATPPREGS